MLTPGYVEPVPPMVSAFTLGWGYVDFGEVTGEPGSATWESANRAVYYQINVPAVCVVRRMWWANGATTTGGATIEAGIYRDNGYKPGVKLISGSATQGTANQVQFVDVTDTTLAPGVYWLALTASTTTNTTLFRSSPASGFDEILRFDQATANPLPASATPVESNNAAIWVCGFSTTTIT